MKIQIDTVNKTVTLLEGTKFSDMDRIKKMIGVNWVAYTISPYQPYNWIDLNSNWNNTELDYTKPPFTTHTDKSGNVSYSHDQRTRYKPSEGVLGFSGGVGDVGVKL